MASARVKVRDVPVKWIAQLGLLRQVDGDLSSKPHADCDRSALWGGAADKNGVITSPDLDDFSRAFFSEHLHCRHPRVPNCAERGAAEGSRRRELDGPLRGERGTWGGRSAV